MQFGTLDEVLDEKKDPSGKASKMNQSLQLSKSTAQMFVSWL